jgi:trypsin-like peptidase
MLDLAANSVTVMQPELKHVIATATFEIHTKERGKGQCVLVDGGLILTAAHCTDYDCKGGMALGDHYLHVISAGKHRLVANTLAVEPVSDIAVLGGPDDQALPDEADAFDELCERTTPVELQREIPEPGVPFSVWIRTHKRTWVAGAATYIRGAKFWYKTRTKIQGGTSGGPIVTDTGELVGLVSHAPESPGHGDYGCGAPLACLALPAWALRRIREARQR